MQKMCVRCLCGVSVAYASVSPNVNPNQLSERGKTWTTSFQLDEKGLTVDKWNKRVCSSVYGCWGERKTKLSEALCQNLHLLYVHFQFVH